MKWFVGIYPAAVALGLVVRGDLRDALVDLAEERLVRGKPFLSSSHRTILGHSRLG
jgi:hypothetical protein